MSNLEDQILEEMLVKTENRANEHLVRTTPLQEAKLRYFLKIMKVDSLQHYFDTVITDLFRFAIIREVQEKTSAEMEEKVRQVAPELQKIRDVFNG